MGTRLSRPAGRRLAVLIAGVIVASCSSANALTGPVGAAPTSPSPAGGDPAGSPPPAPFAALALASPEPAPTPVPTPAPTATADPEAARWATVPVVADEPAALARQIAEAERAIRDPEVTGPKLAWMAHLQQLAYRRLAQRPPLGAALMALVPADVRQAAVANLDAGAELFDPSVPPASRLPAWRIVAPVAASDLLGYYRAAQDEFGVPWQYLAAIHLVETRMGRIRGLSSAGAQGPMQFMPATWAAFGEGDVHSDRDAIRAAARYLRASGAPGNMGKAIWHYNHDDRYVRAIIGYAKVMMADPAAYRGYHGWQVYWLTRQGDVLMPVGYGR